MRPRGVIVALVVLLAGCVEPKDGAQAGPGQDLLSTPPTWECPAGQAQAAGDACLGRLSVEPERLAEPFIAVRPDEPGTLVFGAMRLQPTRSAAAQGTQAALMPMGTAFFASRDGGATWARLDPPLAGLGGDPSLQAGIAADPAFAFAPDGTLHVTSLVQGLLPHQAPRTQGDGFGGSLPFNEVSYTASRDGGTTWTPAVRLSQGDGYSDRNWIGVTPDGTPVATWQRFSLRTSTVAWDDGDGWEQVELEGCTQVSAPRTTAGRVLVLCTMFAEEGAVRLWSVDLATRTAVAGARIGLQCTFAQLAGDGVQLASVCQDDDGILLVASADGGGNWTAPVDLTAAWSAGTRLKAFAADPQGRLHVLALDGAEAVHSVGWGNATRAAQARWPVEPAEGPVPDHYWGLDVASDLGALATTSGSDLVFTRVRL